MIIGGIAIKSIDFMTEDRKLLASITDDNIICGSGLVVELNELKEEKVPKAAKIYRLHPEYLGE